MLYCTSKVYSWQYKEVRKNINFDVFFNITQLLRNVIKPGFHRERPMDKFLARSGFLHLTD